MRYCLTFGKMITLISCEKLNIAKNIIILGKIIKKSKYALTFKI